MSDQMALLPAPPTATATPRGGDSPRRTAECWDLDDHTRELGRQGLAAARQALRQASARMAA